jgi:hypothetical protein
MESFIGLSLASVAREKTIETGTLPELAAYFSTIANRKEKPIPSSPHAFGGDPVLALKAGFPPARE